MKKNNNLTVFELKHTLKEFYGTSEPLGNLSYKVFKWDLKDSPICLDLACFQQKIKQKINFLGISGSSLHFFN